MFIVLVQFPVSSPEKKAELEKLLNSDEGLAFTKSQKGFISVEHGWSTNDEGIQTWWGWEKWNSKEDYKNYFLKRKQDTKWIKKFFDITPESELIKPHEIDNVELYDI